MKPPRFIGLKTDGRIKVWKLINGKPWRFS